MNRWQNDDITATTREAIRLVDQYESDEAYARRLHEELNGGGDALPHPDRRPQPYSFCPVNNQIDGIRNVTEIREVFQGARENITNIDGRELQRNLSMSSEVDEIMADFSELDGNRFIRAQADQDNDPETASTIQFESTDSSDDNSSSSDDEVDERLHELLGHFAGLLNMVIQGRKKGLTPSQIEQLPTQNLREAFTEYNCPVCMDELAQDDQVRRLPCLHILHKDCIDPWLKDNHECPTCKFDISSIFENNDSD